MRRYKSRESLINGYAQRFSLYCGQQQRKLTDDQVEVMRQVAEFVINDGAISVKELNEIDTDLWRKGVTSFGGKVLAEEMQTLSKMMVPLPPLAEQVRIAKIIDDVFEAINRAG